MVLTVILSLIALALLAVLGLAAYFPRPRAIYHLWSVPTPKLKFEPAVLSGLVELVFTKDDEIMDWLAKAMLQYPRLCKIWILGLPMVFLTDPETIEVLLGSKIHIDKGVEYNPGKKWMREGLIMSTGEKWKSRRKMIQPSFHVKIVEQNIAVFEKHARICVENVANAKELLNIEQTVMRFAFDVIGETSMGISLNTQQKQNLEYFGKALEYCGRKEGERRLEGVQFYGKGEGKTIGVSNIAKASMSIVTRARNPFLRHDFVFNLLPQGRAFNAAVKFSDEFTQKVIAERKAEFEKNWGLPSSKPTDEYEGRKKRILLDHLLNIQKTGEVQWTDADMHEEVSTFLFAGMDTVAASLSMVIYFLALEQEHQETVYLEQMDIFGDEDRPITLSDCQAMPFLEKFIKEVQRLYPAPFYLSRYLHEDAVIDGKIIPATSNVIVSPYILHRRPEIYPDPEKFDPERFTPEECAKRSIYAYLPFSAGPRGCIGQKFSMVEMKTFVSLMVRKFKLSTTTKREDLKPGPTAIVRPGVPMWLKATPRHPA